MTESTGCGAPTEEKYMNFVFHIKHFVYETSNSHRILI